MKKNVTLSTQVMAQIRSGRVRMKPHWHYTLLAVVVTGSVVAASIVSAYLISIVFFWVRIQTADTIAWGARAKLNETLDSFPWYLLGVAMLLIAAVVWLVRRQGNMYKYKTSTTALMIASIFVVLGLAVSYVDIGMTHEPLQKTNQQRDSGGTGDSQRQHAR